MTGQSAFASQDDVMSYFGSAKRAAEAAGYRGIAFQWHVCLSEPEHTWWKQIDKGDALANINRQFAVYGTKATRDACNARAYGQADCAVVQLCHALLGSVIKVANCNCDCDCNHCSYARLCTSLRVLLLSDGQRVGLRNVKPSPVPMKLGSFSPRQGQ